HDTSYSDNQGSTSEMCADRFTCTLCQGSMNQLHTALYYFFNVPATPVIYTLSLHDALPISGHRSKRVSPPLPTQGGPREPPWVRSEEHTSELQSRFDLVCRLLLEKKKNINAISYALLIDSRTACSIYSHHHPVEPLSPLTCT